MRIIQQKQHGNLSMQGGTLEDSLVCRFAMTGAFNIINWQINTAGISKYGIKGCFDLTDKLMTR